MVIQSWLLLEQRDHRTDQAQLTAPVPARCHPPQQGARLFVPPQQQPRCQTHHDQQRDGKQGKQARPRRDLLDARLGKAQPPFCIAKSRLTSGTTRILRHGLRAGYGRLATKYHMPHVPWRIPGTAHRHPQRLGTSARSRASVPEHGGAYCRESATCGVCATCHRHRLSCSSSRG